MGAARPVFLPWGLVGDLGELGYCWSDRRTPTPERSTVVVVGCHRAASDGPATAQTVDRFRPHSCGTAQATATTVHRVRDPAALAQRRRAPSLVGLVSSKGSHGLG